MAPPEQPLPRSRRVARSAIFLAVICYAIVAFLFLLFQVYAGERLRSLEHSRHLEPVLDSDNKNDDSNKFNSATSNEKILGVDKLLHGSSVKIGEHETILATLMGSLIRESRSGLVDLIPPEGYFLDAGCNLESLVLTWL